MSRAQDQPDLIVDACKAFGISRSGYYEARRPRDIESIANPEDKDLKKIGVIKLDHTFWGYGMAWAWLRKMERIVINN